MENQLKETHADYINHICTFLASAEAWHAKMGNECRKMGVRGLGRYHDAESMISAVALYDLKRILTDKLHYNAVIDYNNVAQSESYSVATNADFKKHFTTWIKNKQDLSDKIQGFMPHAMIDMQLYKKMLDILHNVQNSIFRANQVVKSFEFGGWNAHDISVKSKWLHHYFEENWKFGDVIDFNIG